MSYTGTTPKFDSVEGDNIKVDGNIISSTDENGNIELIPNGTGIVSVATKTVGDNSNAVASTAYADASSAVVQGNLEDAVDALEAEDLLFLKSDGSRVLTGDLNLNGHKLLNVSNPTLATDGVNKQYADSISGGVVTRPAVKAATTASLGGVYNNGVADNGVGATLNLGPLATLDIDGITSWVQFNGILVKNQTPSLQNGRYFISQVGDGSTDWILTRCSTCDQSDEMPASYMFVQFGTSNAGKGFVALVGVAAGSDSNNFEIGYDSISFTQFSGGSAYSAGDALELTDTEFDVKVDGTTVVVNGSNQLAASSSMATKAYADAAAIAAANSSGFSTGDAVASYVQKPGFLECIGQYVYPDSGYAINSVLPQNSVSTQTISNPVSVTNGNFNFVTWLSTTKFLTQRRSSATVPYVNRYHVYDFNVATRTFGANTDVTATWGFPTTNTGETYEFVGAIDNSLVFCMRQSAAATGVTLAANIKVVNLDSSGNYVSTDTISTGFNIGGASGAQSNIYSNTFYKYGEDLFILIAHSTSAFVHTYRLFKKVAGVWTTVPVTISVPTTTGTYQYVDVYNGYAIFRRYNSATAKYESYMSKLTDGQTFGTFYISTNDGWHYILKCPESSVFDGLVVLRGAALGSGTLNSISLSSGTVSVVTTVTFPEFSESYGAFMMFPYLVPQQTQVYNASKTAYEAGGSDMLVFMCYETNKKVSAFKITINSSGVLTKQIITNETHTVTNTSASTNTIYLASIRGIIERDPLFTSSASRLWVIPSKVQLPTLTALATNLKYYLKVN
jgi:hypothetical protein